MSARHDEEKYLKYATGLQASIEKFFDGQIPVEIVEVSTFYALEVRVMPMEFHPLKGRKVVGRENADSINAILIFSKLESKKWPKAENVIKVLCDICRVPIKMLLLKHELKVTMMDGAKPYEVHKPKPAAVGKEDVWVPLFRADIRCRQSQGLEEVLHTGADGRLEVALYPSKYHFSFQEGSKYDQLLPDMIAVPATFTPVELTIHASLKKLCVFFVVDQAGHACGKFPLKLQPRSSNEEPFYVVTKVDGRCRLRLGRGIYEAAYGGTEELSDWPIQPLLQQLQVQDKEESQHFQIRVERTRFPCEIMLLTHYGEPVAECPFLARDVSGNRVTGGITTDIGILPCDLPVGHFSVRLEPPDDSPFVRTLIEVSVTEDGSHEPREQRVQTKVVHVKMHLVTPDGEPAAHCQFYLEPQFVEGGGAASQARELQLKTDADGTATALMGLLEPYIFRVKASETASEYMQQQFVFQTERRSVTAVVAKTIFGVIPEEKVIILVDTSGSMQVYLEDVKTALNLALVQQFLGSKKRYNILSYTEGMEFFADGLIESTQVNIEQAMRFCDALQAGGGTNLLATIEHVFQRYPDLDAAYLITDGKSELRDDMLQHVRALHLMHPRRARFHTVGINLIPRRLPWRCLHALALVSQASFRPVCLQQESVEPLMGTRRQAEGRADGSVYSQGVDIVPDVAGATTEEEAGGADADEIESSSASSQEGTSDQ